MAARGRVFPASRSLIFTGGKRLMAPVKSSAPAFRWRNKEISERFSAAVVDLVRRHYPEAFDDRGAP
jgi:hypothetical protein